jgi:hypothetical protein
MDEERILGIGEERSVSFPYHTPIRKEEKKHTKTEIWLAKKGIKEDNKSLKGGFRRKKAAKIFPIQGDKDSHFHTISPVRFSTMDEGPLPAPYEMPFPHPHPFLSESVLAAARGATDQFFDRMKALADIANNVIQGRPPNHINCKCEAQAEKWYDFIARGCQCIFKRD